MAVPIINPKISNIRRNICPRSTPKNPDAELSKTLSWIEEVMGIQTRILSRTMTMLPGSRVNSVLRSLRSRATGLSAKVRPAVIGKTQLVITLPLADCPVREEGGKCDMLKVAMPNDLAPEKRLPRLIV